MPTWRYNLQGTDKKEFVKSEYYRVYSNFLASKNLKNVLEKYNYELLFYPHIEFQRFIDTFKDSGRFLWIFFAALRMWTGRIRFRQSMMWTQHQNICQHLTTGLNR